MHPFDRLRAICVALPDVEERLSHGEPTWFHRKGRSFAMGADHHHDDRVAFWCAAPPGAQSAMIEAEPLKFFRPPYVGPAGWIGVYLDVEQDWDEIAAIVEEAHRFTERKKPTGTR